MESLYLWGRSIQEMGGDVVIGRSIYGVVVIDGSLCSRFYGMVLLAPVYCIGSSFPWSYIVSIISFCC